MYVYMYVYMYIHVYVHSYMYICDTFAMALAMVVV